MVLILDGNPEDVAHYEEKYVFSEKYPICDCSQSEQMP